jgi:hypothetical protein
LFFANATSGNISGASDPFSAYRAVILHHLRRNAGSAGAVKLLDQFSSPLEAPSATGSGTITTYAQYLDCTTPCHLIAYLPEDTDLQFSAVAAAELITIASTLRVHTSVVLLNDSLFSDKFFRAPLVLPEYKSRFAGLVAQVCATSSFPASASTLSAARPTAIATREEFLQKTLVSFLTSAPSWPSSVLPSLKGLLPSNLHPLRFLMQICGITNCFFMYYFDICNAHMHKNHSSPRRFGPSRGLLLPSNFNCHWTCLTRNGG